MKAVCVCNGCGRTIEKEFVYCPWCGQSRLASGSQEVLDSVFDRIEEMQLSRRNERIEKIGQKLDALEKELDCLVLSAEMHK